MIRVNIEKAKLIAHDIRRTNREKEFAPYDLVIMKQIPGKDFESAEAARQNIREKYAEIQVKIDSAGSTEEIKEALGI